VNRLSIGDRLFVKQAIVQPLNGGAEHQSGALNGRCSLKLALQQTLGTGFVAFEQSKRVGQVIAEGFVVNLFKVGPGHVGFVSLDGDPPCPVMKPLLFRMLLGGPVKQHGESSGISADEAFKIFVNPSIEVFAVEGHGVVQTEKPGLRPFLTTLPVSEGLAVKMVKVVIGKHRSPDVANQMLNLNRRRT
jgi:hypothetical protein